MTTSIDPELVQAYEAASAALIARVRDAVGDFRAAPSDYLAAWKFRSTPTDCESRVLSNLEEYHDELLAASRTYRAGDIKPITLSASGYKSLSRDLDGYQMDWMTEENRVAVERAMEQVMSVADRIHRLGYRALKELGEV
jgi:hypothetical protein